MSGWTIPVQNAMYGDVAFEVFNVDDSFNRALIEHSYPFVNGADLESMGLNPRAVRLSAVFYGDGYYASFKRFLKVLESNKPAILTHPICGRLQNMICESANFHHEAEFINYVTLDLTFKVATPAKPIFVFNNSVLSQVDKLANQFEGFVANAVGFYGAMMEVIVSGINAKSRMLGAWTGLTDTFNGISGLLGLDDKYRLGSLPSDKLFKSEMTSTLESISSTLDDELKSLAKSSVKDRDVFGRYGDSADNDRVTAQTNDIFSVRSRFDEVLRKIGEVTVLPGNLVKGKNQRTNTNNMQTAMARNLVKRQDVDALECALRLVCSASLVKIATSIIEDQVDTMTPDEIDYLCTKVRLNLLDSLNAVRKLQKDDLTNNSLGSKDTKIYDYSYQVAENIKNQAHDITQLALSAINQRPPLIIRTARFNGTIQQMAHDFYSDYTRSGELLRLNPHIRQPNFIAKGEILNGYAE